MKRMKNDRYFRTIFQAILAGVILVGFTGISICVADDTKQVSSDEPSEEPYKPKSKVQLRRQLSSMQYRVTQQEDTEPAFQNRYWNNKQKGTYRCIVCDQLLFGSDTKFKSGTGWPSFWAPAKKGVVGYREDNKFFYTRVEVHCKRCKAHLGHVFDDGPKDKTGKRYCMNSASLKFRTRDQEAKRNVSKKPSGDQSSKEESGQSADKQAAKKE